MSPERRALRAIVRYVDEEVRPRDSSSVLSVTDLDEQGQVHLRGGYWASTADRAVYCYTLENAKVVQKIIATSLGWKPRQRGISTYCTIEKAEGAIMRALSEPVTMLADKSAGRMKRKRAAALAAGLCSICAREKARANRKTCATCSLAAQERVEKGRYRAAAALDDQAEDLAS